MLKSRIFTFTEKRLLGLSLTASVMALIFTPLTRALPDPLSFILFMVGLWLVLGIITIAFVASLLRLIQTRSKAYFLSFMLSMLAVGVFYINSTTSLFWPYKTY